MFRKVYIDRRVLEEQYRYNGYEGLKDFFMNSNSIIYMADREFCENIVKTLLLGEEEENKRRVKISKLLL